MKSTNSWERVKLGAILFWLLFTVAFAIWWFTLSIQHISDLARLDPDRAQEWYSQKRMIYWEGLTWIILLSIGGGSLFFLVLRERKRVQRIRGFFASFSHEVKTSLASLRLQAESLKDDLKGLSSPLLNRLIADTVRLQLQLENSLFFSSQDHLQLYEKSVSLKKISERLQDQWPDVAFEFSGLDTPVFADERALYTIFSNLVQNSLVHGRAQKVLVSAEKTHSERSEPRILLRVQDDGVGFSGENQSLGQLFYRPKPSSGSGLGLYICRLLVAKMRGDLKILSSGRGFGVEISLAAKDQAK